MYITNQTLHKLENTLHEKCQSDQIPGMALMVSQNGERLFEKMYGYQDMKKQLPVTADTIFGVASITKSIVALAIMQLEDAGKLTVDDSVVHWLPEFKLLDETYMKEISIHHLLTHTAGLPGLDAVHKARADSIRLDPDGEYLFREIPYTKRPVKTVRDIMKVMAEMDFRMLGAPGEVFNYSNEGYALLQEVIERASGEPFFTYVDLHIFQPLQMERSMFLTDDLKEKENVTELYAYTKEVEKTVFHSPVWWDVGAIYGNGSLKASAGDLMRYLEVYRLNGLINGERIVSERSIRKMTAPKVTLPNGNQYGYGLQVRVQSGITFVGHGGSIKGVSSNMQLAKDSGLTVCVLTNIADVAAEELAFTVMNQLLDLATVETLPDYPMTAGQLETYVGHYQSLEGQELRVNFSGNQLYMQQDSTEVALRPYAANRFVTYEGKKLIFGVDEQHNVTGVFRGMRWIPKI